MTRTIRRTPTDQTDALACRSAVLLLQVDPVSALADAELAPHLQRLLGAVGQELEADRESVPQSVRYAAVQLADHIVRQSSIPVPRGPRDADEPVGRTVPGADHATGVPFSRSIRLGRMG